ncbi:MAG: tol-pal system protein YbgF [Burkholderiales bacterium]
MAGSRRGATPAGVPRRRSPAAALAVLAFAALAGPASAGLFDDEEARKRIDETNVRLGEIQRRLDERVSALDTQLKSQNLLEIFNAVEQVKADVARLRGQIEVLTHELAEAQKRQRDLYVDLDSRLRRMESAQAQVQTQLQALAQPAVPPPAAAPVGVPPAVAPTPSTAVPTAPPPAAPAANSAPPAGATPVAPAAPSAGAAAPSAVPAAPSAADLAVEQRNYDAALEQFKRADYPGAIVSFNAFVKAYPKSPLAASAQYWIGNAQYARKDFRAAIAAQRSLLQLYPDSAKVPDAMLNIASAQAELNENAAARRTLEEIIAKYPSSEAATKARQRLGVR